MASLDGLGNALSGSDGSAETASEGVAGAVGVDNLVVGNLADGEHLVLVAVALGNDGAFGALRDNDDARSLAVDLVKGSNLLCNLGNVGGL